MNAPQDAKAKILIVDDDAQLRQVSDLMLRRSGYETLEAGTAEEMLACLSTEKPALILLDVMLANSNGLELCQQIKSDKHWKDIYVILLSGRKITPEERALGLESGADDYLVRPVDRRELLARIKAGLRIRQAEKALRRERDLLDRMMETSPVGITLVNSKGQLTFANARAEEILGLSRDALTEMGYDAPDWHITDYDGQPFPSKSLPFNQVMATEKAVYDVRHAIEKPDGHRTLLSINAAPLRDATGEITGMVSAIEDVTIRIHAERRRREQLKEELRALAGLTSSRQTDVTAAMFGTLPLRKSYPQQFEELSRTYSELLDRALAARLYKVSPEISDALRGVAQRLGELRADPRDVVDLHSAILQSRVEDVNPRKAKAYVEEGHLVVLELMGYLAVYYRNLAMNGPSVKRETITKPKKAKGGEDAG